MADRITELSLEAVMGERFGRYSKYIIQERALPDIRDGLKPVQRRILYAMRQDNNTYQNPYRKSAKAVGNVMGNYHPHGDSSIYEAMVRLSQDWKVREPLIDMNGNNGSIDADPPAAMRYTEARLSQIADDILMDLDKDTVPMVLNFDDTTYEPTVLPSRVPNLFINGASGISAGYATEIPPHNLNEICQALMHLLANPDLTVQELMADVSGPDFPTGGIIQGKSGIQKAYETGRGKIVVRAKTAIATIRGGKKQIIVSELPYDVNKASLVKRIDDLRLTKEVAGITEVRDESDREGLTIVIELSKEANADGILTYLFKKTDLQIAYNFNMVAIHNQRPVHVGLKTGLTAFLDFRRDVVRKRAAYDLAKDEARQHIVTGLIRMLSILDAVVQTIRTSKNRKDAKINLVRQFDFSDAQAEAIVTLQLYRLTNTDVTQLEAEFAALQAKIATLTTILTDDQALHAVINDELEALVTRYGSPRRSHIEADVESLVIDTSVTIAEEDVAVLISRNGYFKRSSWRSYQASGADDNGLTEDDRLVLSGRYNTRQHLWLVTQTGNLIYRPIHELPEWKWKDTGEHFSQHLSNWSRDDVIIAAFVTDDLAPADQSLVLASDDGFIKQVAWADLQPGRTYRKKAALVMKRKHEAAQLVMATQVMAGNDDVFLVTHAGQSLRYSLADVPTAGPRTAGVKAIQLGADDHVVAGIMLTSATPKLAFIATNGAFKICATTEFPVQSRARKGVVCFTQKKTVSYRVAAACALPDVAVGVRILTDRQKVSERQLSDYNVAQRSSNGRHTLSPAEDGLPIAMTPIVLADS